jgi:hypothetical protein
MTVHDVRRHCLLLAFRGSAFAATQVAENSNFCHPERDDTTTGFSASPTESSIRFQGDPIRGGAR